MNVFRVAVLAAVAGLAACTYETTKVQQPAARPAPPPTVVYEPPAPVVQSAPAPTVVVAPAPGQIVVTYSGRGGFELAQEKATAACADRGSGGARLVTDDGAGRATFDCL
ncbi:MAG TPA: hypothetical protein VMQ73_06530 [Methylomirabilota bacterium]|nr:hypothetical protein [Methylomirabilota bacterium]